MPTDIAQQKNSSGTAIYTGQGGRGYTPEQLNNTWNTDSAFRNDPINARVGDLLTQYGYGSSPSNSPQAQQQPSNTPQNQTYNPYAPNPQASNTSNLTGSGQSQDLVNLLMQRAQTSLNIDPMSDPILRPQLDAANAAAQRANRSYLSQAAESQGPNANLDAAGRSLAENTAQGQSQLAASLGQNELTSRRAEIQNALSEAGSMLTTQQQLSLQQELGLIDASLRQQQLGSQNDQFLASLGLQAQNQNNYWNAIQSGLINY